MTVLDNLLTLGILISFFLIIYLRISNKTLIDFFRELKELLSESEEEITQ